MLSLLGNLGIDLPLLIAQVVNFSVLLFILHRFLYKPVMKRIEDDEKFMERILEKENTLKAKEETLRLERERHERESKQRAELLIQDAERIAHEIRSRARTEAHQEKEAVIAQIHSRLNDLSYDHTTTEH